MADSIRVVMDEMQKNMGKGVTVELKRQTKDGALIPASDEHMDALSLQSQLSSVAHVVQHMTTEERTEWAIGTKKLANELYEKGMYREAMAKYIECLTASEFGDEIKKSDIITPKDTKYGAGTKVTLERESASPLNTKTDLIMKSDSNSQETKPAEDKNNQEKKTNNINEVIVPVLNNLTACSMKIFEYSKAIMFCKQLLNIQPNNYKSLCRLSLSYIHIGEYNLALDILDQVDVTEGLSVTALASEKQDRNEFEYSHASTTSSVDQVDENLDSVEIEVSTEKEETKGNIENDRIQYIKCLKYKAKLGLEKEKKNMKQQANALRKVLSKPISKDKIGDNIQELLLNTDLKCDFQNDREVRTNEIADSADRKMKRKESFMDLLFIIVWLFGVFVVSILIIKFIIFIY